MSSYKISDAKLGFELETAAIQFEFDGQDPGKPKGQLVEFLGLNPATGQNGPLPQLSLLPPPNPQEGSAVLVSTAEIGSRLSSVRIEFIFGYRKGAFFGERSQNMSLQAGNRIVEVMTKWVKFPHPNTITMRVGLEHNLPAPNAPPWRCRLPEAPLPRLPLGQDFGSQMTAAFPLAAIPLLLLEERSLVLTGGVSLKFLAIKTESIEDALKNRWGAQWRTDIWRNDISPAYGCNNLMTPESASVFATASPQALPMLMLVMSELNTELKTKNWFWNRANGTELRLSVVQWLQDLCTEPGKDQIAINDGVARNEQIGGLKNSVERMIGKEGNKDAPLCPILEFRNLGNLKWTHVASQAPEIFENPQVPVNYEGGTSILQSLEQWVRDHHSKALSSYSRESTRPATTATGPHTTKPAPGFIPQMASNAAGFALRQLLGGQSSGASSGRAVPPPPPAARTSNPRPPPPPPPAGQPPNAQAAPNPTPQQATPTSQVRQPPVVPARVPGPLKVPPPVPARGSKNQ